MECGFEAGLPRYIVTATIPAEVLADADSNHTSTLRFDYDTVETEIEGQSIPVGFAVDWLSVYKKRKMSLSYDYEERASRYIR